MNFSMMQYVTLTAMTVGGVALATQVWARPTTSLQAIAQNPTQTAPVMLAQARPALARELQGKPVVVDIYASWCPACQNIAPTLSKVKQQYAGKANFIVFDVSNRGSSRSAQAQAKQLGLESFFQSNKSQTSLVAIIDPKTGAVIQEFRGNGEFRDYQAALNQAIKQVKR
jgi:thiol-disulfide isomerase/thioredoxin